MLALSANQPTSVTRRHEGLDHRYLGNTTGARTPRGSGPGWSKSRALPQLAECVRRVRSANATASFDRIARSDARTGPGRTSRVGPVDGRTFPARARLSVDPAAPGGPARLTMDLLLGESYWASDAAPEQALVTWIRQLDRAAAFVAHTPPSPLWQSLPMGRVDWSWCLSTACCGFGFGRSSQSLQRWPERELGRSGTACRREQSRATHCSRSGTKLGRAGAQATTHCARRPPVRHHRAGFGPWPSKFRLPGGRSTRLPCGT